MVVYFVGGTCFVAGLFIGYLLALLVIVTLELSKASIHGKSTTSGFFAKKLDKVHAEVEERVAQIAIDSSKFVTDIRTDNINKVTDIVLGTTTTQQDTINQSVSKLAQLKGR